jgi:hypothetical protein
MDTTFVLGILVFTIMGLYFIFRKNTHRHQISANVDNANCSFDYTSNSFHYSCNLVITYVYNNTTFSNKPSSTKTSFNDEDMMYLDYDRYIDSAK